jgi:hypothetical protein
MKVVLFIIGSLGGLYALFMVVQLIRNLPTSFPANMYGVTDIAARVAAVCLGLAVCLICFQRAFRKPRS